MKHITFQFIEPHSQNQVQTKHFAPTKEILSILSQNKFVSLYYDKKG